MIAMLLLLPGATAFAVYTPVYTYEDIEPPVLMSEITPLDALLKKAQKKDFVLEDTPEYKDCVIAGTFPAEAGPEEMFAYLTEEKGYSVYTASDPYDPQPGDFLFVKSGENIKSYRFISKEGMKIAGKNCVVHVEYPEYEKLCYLYLRQECRFSKNICCGIMANMYCESQFDPNAYEETGQHGVGICQWTGDRYLALKKWCLKNGRNMNSLYAQLDYMKYELESDDFAQLLRMMKNCSYDSDGAYDVAHVFCLFYEDPDNSAEYSELRGAIAQDNFWPSYYRSK